MVINFNKRKVFTIFSVSLLIYMLWPGPSSIRNFAPLPKSEKSTLAGDTWQIPNVAGYFSNEYRSSVVSFYLRNYWSLTLLPIPPLRINYPPEFAFTAIKKHTDSTYLEELVYPLRDSLFVNGFEPFNPDGSPKYWGSTRFRPTNRTWDTKTTIRFYPSSPLIRIIVWAGIVSTIFFLDSLVRRVSRGWKISQ